MGNYIIYLVVAFYLSQFYYSYRKIGLKNFKKKICSFKLDEINFHNLDKINDSDKRFKVYFIDSDKTIIERKMSFFNFGFSVLITKEDNLATIYVYDRSIIKYNSKVLVQDVIHLLKMNNIINK